VEEFFGRYRNLSVLLAVVLAQIILLGYQVRTEQGSTLLQEWTVRGVTPVTKITTSFAARSSASSSKTRACAAPWRGSGARSA
jgi:rod shape-determining protein MreC